MDGAVSPEVRVICCSHCGAPLDVPLGDASVRCEFCGCASVVRQRHAVPAARLATTALSATAVAARRERLKAQHGAVPPLPDAVLPLCVAERLAPDSILAAGKLWLAARAEFAERRDKTSADLLFALTVLLADRFELLGDERRVRALCESACAELDDPRHLAVLHAKLAASAARSGDLPAARTWLEHCDAESDDIEVDSAYRIAAAWLATAEGRHERVLELVGARPTDVPLAALAQDGAALLRANAHASSGDQPAARAALVDAASELPPGWLAQRVAMSSFPCLHRVAAEMIPCVHVPGAGSIVAPAPKVDALRALVGILGLLGVVVQLLFPETLLFGVPLVLIVIGVGAGAVAAWSVWRGIARRRRRTRLARAGVPATGTVLGLALDVERLVVALVVECPRARPAVWRTVLRYRAEHVSRASLVAGAVVPLRVDLADPTNVDFARASEATYLVRGRARVTAGLFVTCVALLGCERAPEGASSGGLSSPSQAAQPASAATIVASPVPSAAPAGSAPGGPPNEPGPRSTLRVRCVGEICGNDYTVTLNGTPVGSVGAISEAPCGTALTDLGVTGPGDKVVRTQARVVRCWEHNQIDDAPEAAPEVPPAVAPACADPPKGKTRLHVACTEEKCGTEYSVTLDGEPAGVVGDLVDVPCGRAIVRVIARTPSDSSGRYGWKATTRCVVKWTPRTARSPASRQRPRRIVILCRAARRSRSPPPWSGSRRPEHAIPPREQSQSEQSRARWTPQSPPKCA
ncbi:MAG: hypothetical protein IT373_02965 [Polyangiaceae bacterium]|nr:hypothetical protein [Polyangiaceae bacterium]